jgi:HEPN domain-containing protein
MKLDLECVDDLDWAVAHSDGVVELRFGALLVRKIGAEGVTESIGRFPDLERFRVADDYFREKPERDAFEASVSTLFPDLAFSWTYDLRIDGRHGR